MPVKHKPTVIIKCSCGMNEKIRIKAATSYCEATDHTCTQCGKEFRVLDHINGCITYYKK